MTLHEFIALGDCRGLGYGLSLTLAADPATGRARENDTSLHAYVLRKLADLWEDCGGENAMLGDLLDDADMELTAMARDVDAVLARYRAHRVELGDADAAVEQDITEQLRRLVGGPAPERDLI